MSQLPLINLCTHPGCKNKARNKIKPGYCPKHRSRIDRHGCPTIRRGKIKAQGPYCSLGIIKRGPTWYWYTIVNSQTVYVHRLLAEKVLGRKLHADEIVHHRDENGLNNREINLEVMYARDHNHIQNGRRVKDKDPF